MTAHHRSEFPGFVDLQVNGFGGVDVSGLHAGCGEVDAEMNKCGIGCAGLDPLIQRTLVVRGSFGGPSSIQCTITGCLPIGGLAQKKTRYRLGHEQ